MWSINGDPSKLLLGDGRQKGDLSTYPGCDAGRGTTHTSAPLKGTGGIWGPMTDDHVGEFDGDGIYYFPCGGIRARRCKLWVDVRKISVSRFGQVGRRGRGWAEDT